MYQYEKLKYTKSDSSFSYLKKAFSISQKLKNDSLIDKSLSLLSNYYISKGDYNDLEIVLEIAESQAKKDKKINILSTIYNFKGLIYYIKGKNTIALGFYHKAYQIAEKNNLYSNQSKILINLGNLYKINNDTIRYLEYLNKSIAITKKHKIRNTLTKALINKGIFYNDENPNKAKKIYKLALEQAVINKDLKSQLEINMNLTQLYLNNNQLNNVIKHLKKAESIQRMLQDKVTLFYIYFNYGAYYFELNKYKKAIKSYNNALKIAENTNIPPDRIVSIYESISIAYEKNKNFKVANDYYKMRQILSDSIFTIEQNKIFNDLQTKYEVEKKNLKINILTKENQIEAARKKQILYISLVLLIPLIGLLFFYRHRIKTQRIIREKENKIHHQEVIRLEQDQELKRIRGVVEGQDQERNRVAKEIHDGVGGTLAGIKLQLAQVNSIIKSEDVSMIVNQLSNAFNELRSISHNLSLNYLTDKNLTSLLQGLQNEYKKRNEFQIEIVIFPENSLIHLTDEIKHQVYRIIQELLANIAKHAKAKDVTINITNHDDSLNIMVEDDGCGFDTNFSDGIGLKNIKERLASVNGELTIESTIGKGSTIIIDIPNIL